jgi:transcriptional regulator with XRE-family HTH domain
MIDPSLLGEVDTVVSVRFGQNLRALRERAGLTQRGLAKRLGFSGPSTVSHWEGGDALPSPHTMTKLAAALRCSTAELLAGVVSPYEALRGVQELPASDPLLSEDETRIIAMYRECSVDFKTAIRDTLLPVFVDVTKFQRRRRRR